MLPTAGFESITGLYDVDNTIGEVALCNLASIVVSRIKDDEHYERVAYNTLKIVDNTIENGIYPFPQVERTAKARRSVGIGMTDLATLMAERGLKYDTQEGRTFIHQMAERHSYFLHKASVRLAKERGACEWMSETKYNDGWLPIDTYNKAVDEYHNAELKYDWEGLRKEIDEHGIRFSVLESYMPSESSSVLTATTNSIYPIRKKELFKNSQKGSVYFRVDEDLDYQMAFDIDHLDMVKVYAVVQKFTGQGISADFYTKLDGKSKVAVKDVLQRMILAAKLGMKTFYYENFQTGGEEVEKVEDDCESCKL